MVQLTNLEMLTLLVSRELRNGDRVHVGANQDLVLNAVALAHDTRGIHVNLTAVGGRWFGAPERAVGLPTYSRATVEAFDAPLDQERAFDDLQRPPIVFAGGLQVDRTGNVNLIGIGHDGRSWKVRGPGSAGLPSLTGLSETYFAYVAKHDPKTLVERVDFISAVGSPGLRRELGLPVVTRGAVLTPLCRFEWKGDYLAVTHRVPGVSLEELRERTPFDLDLDQTLPHIDLPSESELAWLEQAARITTLNEKAKQ